MRSMGLGAKERFGLDNVGESLIGPVEIDGAKGSGARKRLQVGCQGGKLRGNAIRRKYAENAGKRGPHKSPPFLPHTHRRINWCRNSGII